MEAVDSLDVERLELARRPEHRVERDAAVEPGARIAREELIGERGQHEVRRVQRLSDRRPDLVGDLEDRDTPGQPGRELVGRHLAEPRRERLREHRRHFLGADAAREKPFAGLPVLERLREQLVQEQNLDAAFAHQVDERVVLLPRAAHPDHVVEEELVGVRRREPLVGEVGPVHHHGAEPSDLRMRAQNRVGDSAHELSPFMAQPVAAEIPMKAQTTTKTAIR